MTMTMGMVIPTVRVNMGTPTSTSITQAISTCAIVR